RWWRHGGEPGRRSSRRSLATVGHTHLGDHRGGVADATPTTGSHADPSPGPAAAPTTGRHANPSAAPTAADAADSAPAPTAPAPGLTPALPHAAPSPPPRAPRSPARYPWLPPSAWSPGLARLPGSPTAVEAAASAVSPGGAPIAAGAGVSQDPPPASTTATVAP